MEILIELLIWATIGYLVSRVAITWLMNYLTREIRTEVEEFVNRLDSGKLIPVTVEVDQNQYFCYNALTKDFVCQGYSLKELAERFSARFPEGKLAIYNGDEAAVQTLKGQLEKVYEDRNSK